MLRPAPLLVLLLAVLGCSEPQVVPTPTPVRIDGGVIRTERIPRHVTIRVTATPTPTPIVRSHPQTSEAWMVMSRAEQNFFGILNTHQRNEFVELMLERWKATPTSTPTPRPTARPRSTPTPVSGMAKYDITEDEAKKINGCVTFGNLFYDFTEDRLTYSALVRGLRSVGEKFQGTSFESDARFMLAALESGRDEAFAYAAKGLAQKCLDYLVE